jgi:hypothetical protein
MKDGYRSYSPVLGLGYREISACAGTCRQRGAQGMKRSEQWTTRSWYLGRVLVENRNWLIAAAMVTYTDGCAERDAALSMLVDKQQDRARVPRNDFGRASMQQSITPMLGFVLDCHAELDLL